jgi:hypothetical protein
MIVTSSLSLQATSENTLQAKFAESPFQTVSGKSLEGSGARVFVTLEAAN